MALDWLKFMGAVILRLDFEGCILASAFVYFYKFVRNVWTLQIKHICTEYEQRMLRDATWYISFKNYLHRKLRVLGYLNGVLNFDVTVSGIPETLCEQPYTSAAAISNVWCVCFVQIMETYAVSIVSQTRRKWPHLGLSLHSGWR